MWVTDATERLKVHEMMTNAQPGFSAHPQITGDSDPLRAGWDNCALEIAQLPRADKTSMVNETLPLRLAG